MDITGGIANSGGFYSPVNSRKIILYDPKFHRWSKNAESAHSRTFSTTFKTTLPQNKYGEVKIRSWVINIDSLKHLERGIGRAVFQVD